MPNMDSNPNMLIQSQLSCASVITLKPATCGQFKTGHFAWPET
jgi:hypothetical protein